MTTKIELQLTMAVVECAGCAMPFAAPQRFETDRRRDHGNFYCPKGHTNYFPGKSDVEQARDVAARERVRAEQAERTAANLRDNLRMETLSHRSTKGQLTKVRKRISHGVCPCCQRTFANVARHMTTQHPDFVESTG